MYSEGKRMEMHDRVYSTGEFAKLCGTTKDTLFLYDKKGILHPEIVRENGYRGYGYKEFSLFWMIKFFKAAGLSLDEIAKMQAGEADSEIIVNTLREKRAEVAKAQLELAGMQRFIERAIDNYQKSEERQSDISIEKRPEEYLIKTEAAEEGDGKYPLALEKRMMLKEYIMDIGFQYELRPGDIISRENFMNDNYMPSFFYEKIDCKAHLSTITVKPAGTYLCARFAPWTDLPKYCREMKHFAEEKGFRFVGDLYYYDDLPSFLKGKESGMASIAEIMIERI